jgi:hypothetical protein
MRLAGSWHRTECYRHPPVCFRALGPFPFAEALGRVVEFVVAEIVVRVFNHW